MRTLILMMALLLLNGCAPKAEEVRSMGMPELRSAAFYVDMEWNPNFRDAVRQRFFYLNPDWDAATRQTIEAGQVSIDMTMDQVTASWGRPLESGPQSQSAFGTTNVWVYGKYPYSRTICFYNGKVSSIHSDR